MSGTATYWSVLVLIRPSLMPRQHLESTSDRYMTMEVCGASLMACVAWTKMCAACGIIGSMCEWRLVRGLWYPYDRTYHILPMRDSKRNIIGATPRVWCSVGLRPGLGPGPVMLPPKHTPEPSVSFSIARVCGKGRATACPARRPRSRRAAAPLLLRVAQVLRNCFFGLRVPYN